MDENTIREASALFAIEEVTKLMDQAAEVNKNLEINLARTDSIFEQYSNKQSLMLSKVGEKLKENNGNVVVENKNSPGIKIFSFVLVSLVVGIAIGYFMAKL